MKLVKGLPEQQYHSNALCGACQRGKIVKTNFRSKNIVSTSRPLELLHIDLFGEVKTASINGKKYGLIIVDDYNKWSKNEAYDVFIQILLGFDDNKVLKINSNTSICSSVQELLS